MVSGGNRVWKGDSLLGLLEEELGSQQGRCRESKGETVRCGTKEVMGHVGRIQVWDFIPVPLESCEMGRILFCFVLRTVLASEGKGGSGTRVEVEAQ